MLSGNSLSVWRRVTMLSICIAAAAGMAFGQDYPAPRHPTLTDVTSVDELMPIAKQVARGVSRRAFAAQSRFGIKAGEKVLLIVPGGFNPLVREALARAIRDEGARLDVVELAESGREAPDHHGMPPDGSVEARRMLEPSGAAPEERGKVLGLTKLDKYDLVIGPSAGGPKPLSAFRWEHLPWNTVEKFMTAAFPDDVQSLLDEKVWALMAQARRIHVTDPEGTDVTWSVSPATFEHSRQEWDDPVFPRGTYDIVIRGHISLNPLFVADALDAKGVVAGTINHAGVFPRVKLFLVDGQVTRAEGGGSYGENVGAVVRKYQNVQWPGFPGKGVGWFIESALGTHPKVSRVTTSVEGESMTWERGRSGVIHWGFGVSIPPGASFEKEYREKVAAEKLTQGHFHVHTYFSTVDLELNDGKTVRLVNKGRLTALDDPDVRRLAAKYGDPDKLLQEEWIPALPGINSAGSYEDYARDPGSYVKKDVESIKRVSKKQ